MSLLRILSVLIIFLSGWEAIAYSPLSFHENPPIEETEVYSDEKEKISQSTISGFLHNLVERGSSEGNINFYFSSLHTARLSAFYINNSRYIDPGLNIYDIIFPFHFFT